jgi:hypothetical protein
MATEQMQVKPAAVPKYEAVFEQQIGRAVGRIRLLDVLAAVLGLSAIALLYALLMLTLDRWLELSAPVRQTMFVLFLLSAGVYLAVFVFWPLCRSVNPYYAARRLEETIPEAKNSVVNWLDLRHEQLPPPIRGAVGQRAARDAVAADIDQAISGRRTIWAGSATGILVLALLITLGFLGPGQFWSLLGRALAPFGAGSIRTRTQIELLQPANGDATVANGHSVTFVAALTGKVPGVNRPDSPRLLFRYRLGDPYEERPLEREKDSEWQTILPANQVHSGFWYKIAAGDAETPEYQVKLRSTPLVEKIDVTYHFRPYLGWRDASSTDPNLEALRGTEVTLIAHTNRAVKMGLCLIQSKDAPQQEAPGELVTGDDNALRFKFVIERNGHYRINFTSAETDANPGSSANTNLISVPYTITALRDYPPVVDLKKPGQDVTLPSSGLLQLEGSASDDLGVASMTLRMQIVGGASLEPKPYRPGKSFQLPAGGYPKMLEYKDAVELDKVKDTEGKPFALQPKMVVEYWLEAADACDFPAPNVGESKHFKVTIAEPNPDQKQQQEERQKAQQEQKQHEQQQDKKLDKENQDRQENAKNDKKDGQQGSQENKADQGDGKPDANPKPDPKAKETEDKLQKEFDKQDEQQNEKGSSKQDGDNQKAEPKDDGSGKKQEQPGSAKDKGEPQKNPQPGDGPGQKEGKEEPGQAKDDGGKKEGGPPQQGENKGQGQDEQKQDKGENKQGGGSGQPKPAEPKEGKEPGAQQDKANAKNGGDKGGKPDAAQSKDPGNQAANQEAGSGDSKGAQKAGPMNDKGPAGAAKDDGKEPMRAEKKEIGKPAAADAQAKGQPKDDGGAGAREKGPKAETKPEGDKQGGAAEAVAKDDKKLDQRTGSAGSGDAKDKSKEPDKGSTGATAQKDGDKDPKQKPGSARDADSQKDNPGEKATSEDIARLNQALQREEGKKQEDAARQLAQAANSAKDANAREEARKALEQAGRDPKNGEPNPAAPKPEPKNNGQQPGDGKANAESKGPPDKKTQQPGDSKGGDGSTDQKGKTEEKGRGNAKGTSEGTETDNNPNDQRPPAGTAKDRSKGPEGREPSQSPGGGAPGEPGAGDDSPARPGAAPNERDRRKKGELLLERFDKLLEKDKKKFLEDARLNEDDLKRLREDIARRKTQGTATPEKSPNSKGQGTRSNRAANQLKPGAKPRAGDTQYGGSGEPPVELREIFREFSGSSQEKK